MPTRDVVLTEHLNELIDNNVQSGRFADASEVVSEALRLLEERDADEERKLAWLSETATETVAAFDRGDGLALEVGEVDSFVDNALQNARGRSRTAHA